MSCGWGVRGWTFGASTRAIPILCALAAFVACGSEPGDAAARRGRPARTVESFCAEARTFEAEQLSALEPGEDDLDRRAEGYRRLLEAAPEPIRDDVEVLHDLWLDAAEHDVRVDIGGPDAAASIRPYRELLERHPGREAAGRRVQTYLYEECDVAL